MSKVVLVVAWLVVVVGTLLVMAGVVGKVRAAVEVPACQRPEQQHPLEVTGAVEVTGSRIRGQGEAVEGEREEIVAKRHEAQVGVELHQYESAKQVVRACLRMGAWAGMSETQVLEAHPAPGCNAFDPEAKTCVVHTLRPRYVEDDERMQNMGHEVLHCFEGAYHKQD